MKTNLKFLKPMITHVPFDNCVLGILQNYPKTYDWIYSNFINIYINKNTEADYFFPKFLWSICPFIDSFAIPYKLIVKNHEQYTDFLESCLSEGFYVYTLVNRKYIKKYGEKVDDDHNAFISNIDSKNKIVEINDFFNEGVYESYNCPYEEINDAFIELPKCIWFGKDDYLNENAQIILLKYNDNRKYDFSYDHFQEKLRQYLGCKNQLSDYTEASIVGETLVTEYWWGIECWNSDNHIPLTIRYFSLLRAHSQMWSYRYNYFVEKNYIGKSDFLENIIRDLNIDSQRALSLYLRDVIKNNSIMPENIPHINKIIDECREKNELICNWFLR